MSERELENTGCKKCRILFRVVNNPMILEQLTRLTAPGPSQFPQNYEKGCQWGSGKTKFELKRSIRLHLNDIYKNLQ